MPALELRSTITILRERLYWAVMNSLNVSPLDPQPDAELEHFLGLISAKGQVTWETVRIDQLYWSVKLKAEQDVTLEQFDRILKAIADTVAYSTSSLKAAKKWNINAEKRS